MNDDWRWNGCWLRMPWFPWEFRAVRTMKHFSPSKIVLKWNQLPNFCVNHHCSLVSSLICIWALGGGDAIGHSGGDGKSFRLGIRLRSPRQPSHRQSSHYVSIAGVSVAWCVSCKDSIFKSTQNLRWMSTSPHNSTASNINHLGFRAEKSRIENGTVRFGDYRFWLWPRNIVLRRNSIAQHWRPLNCNCIVRPSQWPSINEANCR